MEKEDVKELKKILLKARAALFTNMPADYVVMLIDRALDVVREEELKNLDQIEIKTHINDVTIDRWNKLKDFYAELENAIINAIDSVDKVMKESEQ